MIRTLPAFVPAKKGVQARNRGSGGHLVALGYRSITLKWLVLGSLHRMSSAFDNLLLGFERLSAAQVGSRAQIITIAKR